MFNNKIVRLLFGCISCLVLIAIIACTPAAPVSPIPVSPPTTTPAQDKPVYGGNFKIIILSSPGNVGAPWEPRSPNDALYSQPAIETFLRVDENGLPSPWLAESWTVSPDGKDITFKIRKGVKFHDGTDLDAKAIKYNLDKMKASTFPEFKAISSVDVIDDYTVRVTLSAYSVNFMSALALTRIISPTAAEKNSIDWLKSNAVGTGPFKFVSYTRDVSMKFQKYDGYWQKGKPYLDSIEWIVLSDPTTAYISFQKGDANVFSGIIAKDALELQKDSKFKLSLSVAGMFGLGGDTINANSPFANLKVRQAISYAIDNKAISNAIGTSIYPPADQLFPPASWAYNPSIIGYPYNPTKAKALLAEAGFTNGFSTKIIFSSGSPADVLFPAVQSYLKAVGIDATLDAQGSGAYSQTRGKGWSNALVNYENPTGVGMEPSQAMAGRLASSWFASIKCPDDFLTKLNSANSEPDFNKRKVLVQELLKMAIDQYAIVTPLIYVNSRCAKTQQVQGEKLIQIWTQQWTPEDAWLSK